MTNPDPSQIRAAFKIVTAGDGGVGKTTLLHRYVENEFIFDTKMTIGVGFFQKFVNVGELKNISLQLWDFGGEEHFRAFLDSYMLGAAGAILMFDLTRPKTLNKLDEWVSIIRKYDKNLPVMFLGGKLDLTEFIGITDDIALEMKDKYEFLDYLRVSSKENHNIEKAFEILTQSILKHRKII